MEPVLSVRNLKTYFALEQGVLHAVDGLSYDLHPGRTLAIVGESGSGKSVHSLSILRLVEPPGKIVSGEILFGGKNLLALPDAEMRKIRGDRIAMVFQEPLTSLNPVLTVGEQIAEAVRLHLKLTPRQSWERAVEMLSKVGIPNPKERVQAYPHQFSGGMRQRVMIAMALSCNPDVLIADEPTSALDVTVQAQILELIKALQREMRMAVILITHNLGIVAEVADEVLVMYAGNLVEKAPAAELFRNPRHPYTWGLLNSIPKLHKRQERLESISGQPPVVLDPVPCCRFNPRCEFRMQVCKMKDTIPLAVGEDHEASCWLYGEEAEKDALERSRRRIQEHQASLEPSNGK